MSTDLKWEGGGGAGVEAEESPMLMFLEKWGTKPSKPPTLPQILHPYIISVHLWYPYSKGIVHAAHKRHFFSNMPFPLFYPVLNEVRSTDIFLPWSMQPKIMHHQTGTPLFSYVSMCS